MGCGKWFETKGEVSCDFQVALQDQACCGWHHQEAQSSFCCARGFSQIEGVGYDGTFAPVARFSSIKAVISIVAEMGWRIDQMDVKTAFLNDLLQEEVYLE